MRVIDTRTGFAVAQLTAFHLSPVGRGRRPSDARAPGEGAKRSAESWPPSPGSQLALLADLSPKGRGESEREVRLQYAPGAGAQP
jgi:hypothetical protein